MKGTNTSTAVMARTKDTSIAFAFAATAMAYKARTGQLTVRDRLSLAERALEWLDGESAARAATASFLAAAYSDPADAGEQLLQFIAAWRPSVEPYRPGEVLARVEAEAPDWTTRKDCGHE